MKPYKKENIPLAKVLRKDMTPWERKLWYNFLRNYPVRFQRQKCIGEYIADFYCAKAQLVIELDGSGHYMPEQAATDQVRTQKLEDMHLTVLRFSNLDVDENFTGVCEYIDMFVKQSLPQSASLTAPSSEGATAPAKTIYALGFFDGVHLGHQALLRACRELADSHGCRTGVVTFSSHPDGLVLGKDPALINTPEDREKLLKERFFMEEVVALPFDKAMMTMPWQDFLQLLFDEYDAAGLVCGADFRFGSKGAGTAALLAQTCREKGLPCAVVPQLQKEGIPVSSTYIRSLLEQGEMDRAVAFLGHPHILTGTVVTGRRLGRTLGIPTANLTLPEQTVSLRHGVYACKALTEDGAYLAVTNVGSRPTVGGHRVTVEPWLLDFDGDLYGKLLTLEFYTFLRPEKKFSSLEELKAEIQKNAEQTRKILEKN